MTRIDLVRADQLSGAIAQSYAGYNTAGGSWDNLGGTTVQKILLKKVTLASAALVASIGAYVKGDNAHGGQLSAGILDDSSGTPRRVIARSGGQGGGDLNLGIDTNGRWIDMPMGVWLVAGDYWLAIQGMAGTGGMQVAYDGSGADWVLAGSNNEMIWDHAFSNYSSGSNKYSIRATLIR